MMVAIAGPFPASVRSPSPPTTKWTPSSRPLRRGAGHGDPYHSSRTWRFRNSSRPLFSRPDVHIREFGLVGLQDRLAVGPDPDPGTDACHVDRVPFGAGRVALAVPVASVSSDRSAQEETKVIRWAAQLQR